MWADEIEPGYREWESGSEMVRVAWRAVVAQDGTWTTGGSEFWGLAFTRYPDGRHVAQIVGPTLKPRTMSLYAGEVSWGVDLAPHVFWRGLAKTSVVDELRDLPTERVGEQWWFELGGVRWPVPAVEELDATVERLRANGLLVAEPLIGAVLAGEQVDVPERTVRRRFQATTGLRRGQVEQLRRARRAYTLLTTGWPLAEAAVEAGFADQAHMTRELRRLAGSTPARLLDAGTTSL